MTEKNSVWTLVIKSLGSKLTRTEIKTWFSQTTCNRLDNNIAIIGVPNKFVATWLKDNYLSEINNSFRKVLKETPQIHFQLNSKNSKFLPKKLDKKIKINSNLLQSPV